MDGLYYKHSGKFSVGGAIYALVLGSVVLCFCAFFYAYLILYLPFVYINALITVGFGCLVGFTCATLLKRKKVRSDSVAIALTLVLTFIAYYYSWVSWLWALLRRDEGSDVHLPEFFALLVNPAAFWRLLLEVNQQGAWSLRGSDPVTGIPLWLVWLAELGLIFGFSLYTAYNVMEEEPFCETCEEWGKKKEKVVEAATTNLDEFRQRMEAKDFHYLEGAGTPAPEAMEWQRLDLFSCPKCGSFHTVDSSQVKIKVESGKRKENTKVTLHHLLLTASEAENLRKLGEKMNPKPVPATPPPAG